MKEWIRQLDRLLRGDATRIEALRAGTINIDLGGLVVVSIVLGVIYGLCMGVFALTGSGSGAPMQILASAIKVPSLFYLTLLVTFPSLYVFNALVGSRLGLVSVVRLLVAAIGIMMTVLASIGPIVAFFALTTTSYPFMLLLNVAVFSLAGFLGGGFLLRTLHRLTIASEMEAETREIHSPMPPVQTAPPQLDPYGQPVGTPPLAARPIARPKLLTPGANVRSIFRIWVLVFGLVGAQMAWIMRPFIGDPNLPFQWFRPRSSNFFEAVFHAIEKLFS